MKLQLLVVAAIAILAGVFVFLMKKKEKYTSGVALGPVIRSPNSETYDVLQWSLGGFGGSPKPGCPNK
ncbi:hypothetical protein ATCVMN08101_619L [Acanthocystis turfacea Chlorella virus MN0810.1]|nr:hypothetical protein ATCVMN08101_619L [Acanthocystis turfacea Chlorella virus MN0810.1]